MLVIDDVFVKLGTTLVQVALGIGSTNGAN